MKKIFFFLVLFSLKTLAQKSDSLVFDKNFHEVENQWVAMDNAKAKNQYWYAFLYYDKMGGGYFLYNNGDFFIENGDFFDNSGGNSKTNNIIALPNGNIPFAKLPQKAIEQMKLKTPDVVLKNKNTLIDKNLENLLRANTMNTLQRPDLALSVLQKLHHSSFSKPEFKKMFYSELVFAYKALGQKDNAEKTINEAKSHGIHLNKK